MQADDRERRRKTVIRVMLGTMAVLTVGSVGTAVGLGLAEHSVGWGFAGAFIFCGFGMIASLIALTVRGQLRQAGRLYRQAAQPLFTPVFLRRRRPDSN